MNAGISTLGLRVAGVPIGNDDWVQQYVREKAAALQVHVSKFYIIFDGLMDICLAFLGVILQLPSQQTFLHK